MKKWKKNLELLRAVSRIGCPLLAGVDGDTIRGTFAEDSSVDFVAGLRGDLPLAPLPRRFTPREAVFLGSLPGDPVGVRWGDDYTYVGKLIELPNGKCILVYLSVYDTERQQEWF